MVRNRGTHQEMSSAISLMKNHNLIFLISQKPCQKQYFYFIMTLPKQIKVYLKTIYGFLLCLHNFFFVFKNRLHLLDIMRSQDCVFLRT